MAKLTRRNFLKLSTTIGSVTLFPTSIQKALAIPANNNLGSIKDVEHVVILMQENRSFDHYFGTLSGVRGFGDRFPIPLAGDRTVWQQKGEDRIIMPYHLNDKLGNAQRVLGTPHSWTDAHKAWENGKMGNWPTYKTPTSMGYYKEQELPFHFALANSFTICDAYHCSMHAGTNPNRLFHWTGTNGPTKDVSPSVAVVVNEWDRLGTPSKGYTWKTFPERLEKNGVSWKIYQSLPNNFGDNPLAGFRQYRSVNRAVNPVPFMPPFITQYAKNLIEEGFYAVQSGTKQLSDDIAKKYPLYKGIAPTLKNDMKTIMDNFKDDVNRGKLPSVSWIIPPDKYSEHPGPSSPAQGAWITQEILNILTENTNIWSKTVFIVNFDENDGFFDHIPSPSAPSLRNDGTFAGKSTVPFEDTEIYKFPNPPGSKEQPKADNEIFGPGPRVPALIISPWSRGGWVNSQVFDHTSIIQFLEKRFDVYEPNISEWRRTVCGDLTSCFNFKTPNDELLPKFNYIDFDRTNQIVKAQEALPQIDIPTVDKQHLPVQNNGIKLSRSLPYELLIQTNISISESLLKLKFFNTGKQGAVFHVYNKLDLNSIPQRYTVSSKNAILDTWKIKNNYDLWLLGPNGFHRSFKGNLSKGIIDIKEKIVFSKLCVTFINPTTSPIKVSLIKNLYNQNNFSSIDIPANGSIECQFDTKKNGGWYDLTFKSDNDWLRRFAGRIETGEDSITDPLMGFNI